MNITKFISTFFAVAVVSVSAFAGNLTLTIGDEARLAECGGMIQVTKSQQGNGEQLNVVFRGVENCSNFDIVKANGESLDYSDKKLQGTDRNRGGSFTLPKRFIELGRNNIKVVVRSNSGKTSDSIALKFKEVIVAPIPAPREIPAPRPIQNHSTMTLMIGDEAYLSACGGKVEVTKSAQGNDGSEQLNLVFRGVEKCSNFDILSNDGAAINYDNKKIQGNDGNRGGSFTLPKRVLDMGWNNVKVVVKSNSGQTSDTIRIQVKVVPTTPDRRPLPQTPSSGDSSW